MAVPTAVRQIYDSLLPSLEPLAEYVAETISEYCSLAGYQFGDRLKTLESLSEKLESGRYASVADIDDLYGSYVVVPTDAHEQGVREFLEGAFHIATVRERRAARSAPDIFRFNATRVYARVKEGMAPSLEGASREILFEVQIRTAFEHAWSSVTHDRVYKANEVNWERLRLSAHLKAAVEQLDLLVRTFDDLAAAVPASIDEETSSKGDIVNTFKELLALGHINENLTPQSWARFADNVWGLVRSYSNRRQAPARVEELLAQVRASVTAEGAPPPPVGGSLFQLVLGVVGTGQLPRANLDQFVIVDSPELAELHGMDHIPKPFGPRP